MPAHRHTEETLAAMVAVDDEGCWLWTGATNYAGYPSVSFGDKSHRAHRLFYSLLIGPIPDGLTLDHLCGVRRCVNPGHVECVTAGENALRGDGPCARNARATHCKHGHEFTAENTVARPGGRDCRTCRNRRPQRTHEGPGESGARPMG